MKFFIHLKYWLYASLLGFSTLCVCGSLLFILLHIFHKAAVVLSWQFVFGSPLKGMTEGGILPAILGTTWITLTATLLAVPFGVACAVYLHEFASNNLITQLIRASIRNLAGIPSVIYGLFGMALFVEGLQLGASIMAAGLTLALLSLPYIITTTEEALSQVPIALREGTWALGATRFETLRDIVLPQAFPGILTGIILTLSRAAGETAPILFTGVAFYVSKLPSSLSEEFMALPYHLYMLATQHQAVEKVKPLAYGTAAVLIVLVFALNLVAIYLRQYSKKIK